MGTEDEIEEGLSPEQLALLERMYNEGPIRNWAKEQAVDLADLADKGLAYTKDAGENFGPHEPAWDLTSQGVVWLEDYWDPHAQAESTVIALSPYTQEWPELVSDNRDKLDALARAYGIEETEVVSIAVTAMYEGYPAGMDDPAPDLDDEHWQALPHGTRVRVGSLARYCQVTCWAVINIAISDLYDGKAVRIRDAEGV